MRCAEFQERLPDHVASGVALATEVRTHLERCGDCREFHEGIQRFYELEVPDGVPAGFKRRKSLRGLAQERERTLPLHQPITMALAAAAVLVLGLVIAWPEAQRKPLELPRVAVHWPDLAGLSDEIAPDEWLDLVSGRKLAVLGDLPLIELYSLRDDLDSRVFEEVLDSAEVRAALRRFACGRVEVTSLAHATELGIQVTDEDAFPLVRLRFRDYVSPMHERATCFADITALIDELRRDRSEYYYNPGGLDRAETWMVVWALQEAHALVSEQQLSAAARRLQSTLERLPATSSARQQLQRLHLEVVQVVESHERSLEMTREAPQD